MSPEKITSSMRSIRLQNKHLVTYTHKTIVKSNKKKIKREKDQKRNIDILIQRRINNESKTNEKIRIRKSVRFSENNFRR